jgi:hypothetical protein
MEEVRSIEFVLLGAPAAASGEVPYFFVWPHCAFVDSDFALRDWRVWVHWLYYLRQVALALV